MKRIVMGLLALGLLIGNNAWAVVTINSQGTSLAPKSVSNSAVIVLPANANRWNWTMYSETQALRCTVGTYSQSSGAFTAPATAPTASVGYYIPSGVQINEKQLVLGPYAAGPDAFTEDEAKVEVDCISVSGTAGNVDTWEELKR